MDDCIFCKIVRGEIPSQKVFENEKVYAFLDATPKSKGHTLVIPKIHSSNIFEVSEEDLEEVVKVVKLLSIRIKDRLNPEGIYIRQNNGEIAGQTVNHIHFHIVPQYEYEGEYDVDEVSQILLKD